MLYLTAAILVYYRIDYGGTSETTDDINISCSLITFVIIFKRQALDAIPMKCENTKASEQ